MIWIALWVVAGSATYFLPLFGPIMEKQSRGDALLDYGYCLLAWPYVVVGLATLLIARIIDDYRNGR